MEVNVSLTKEDIQVINKGENAAFRIIESRTTAAYMTMGAFIDIAAFLNGVNANYTKNINGLPEALNDNTTASWDGKIVAVPYKSDYMLETPGIRQYATA